jgi:hypothetical protein
MHSFRDLSRFRAVVLLSAAFVPQSPTAPLPESVAQAQPQQVQAEQMQPASTLRHPRDSENVRCEAERRRVASLPGLPGAPAIEAARPELLGYTKAEPVLFVRAPELSSDVDATQRAHQNLVQRPRFSWSVVRRLTTLFSARPDIGRASVLREGYLYADRPELAYALVDHIGAHHLFREPRIWIQRGGTTYFAERHASGKYRYVDGPEADKPVRLLLFDRIGVGEPALALHRDVRGLMYRLHFDRMRVEHLTEDRVVATLRYGDVWVPSLLRAEGARLELECEAIPDTATSLVADRRALEARRTRALAELRRAMVDQIEEALPFDEPLTEYGQQDGRLRRKWYDAYVSGRRAFRYQGDLYYVYDQNGRPRPPQVCVDFLTDTFERASGTWWKPLGQEPGRTQGRLDFATLTDETLRRAPRFIELVESQSQNFDVVHYPPEDRMEFWRGARFYRYLVDHADDMRAGDIVLIRGYAPWDKPWQERVMHYHSFFIYENDPLTGMPILLVGNPGTPSIRTWRFETLRTPRRSIWHVVRPRTEWLENIANPSHDRADEPALLSVGPS